MKVASMKIYNRIPQTDTFGLIGFDVRTEKRGPAPAAISVSIGDRRRVFTLEELHDARPGTWRTDDDLVFHVNTFLLPNGPALIEVHAADASGREVGARLAAYDIVVDNRGELASRVKEQLRESRSEVFLPAMVDSAYFGNHEAPSMTPWFDEPLGFGARMKKMFSTKDPSREAMSHLQEFGYCVLPQRIPDDLCDELVRQATELVRAGAEKQGYEWGSSQRVLNMHSLPAGRSVWLYPAVIQFLKEWFRDDPVACQTLFYFFGSQQRAHQDTIHLTPFPAGYMCGVWIALEDVKAGSGELFVYPKSHRLRRLRARKLGLDKVASDYSAYEAFDREISRAVSEAGLESKPYLPKKGSILVWHENLVHGGAPRIDMEQSRLSIVSHYFARSAVAYYDARGEGASLVEG